MDKTSFIGKHIDYADTPVLWLNIDAFDRNVIRMNEFCNKNSVIWRPHVKASKSPDLALRLINSGAVGITCAKVSEAEVMVAGGVRDLLIANEIVGNTKINRLIEISKLAKVCVACDDEQNIQDISKIASDSNVIIDVLVDLNVGMDRCGVHLDKAPVLAKLVSDLPGVRLRGLMGYEGHVMGLDSDDKRDVSKDVSELISVARRNLESQGFEIEICSGGGTGNYWHSASLGGINELQAGGGALMDVNYMEQMNVPNHEYALFINAQIVSTSVAGQVVLDSGWKTTGRHTGLPKVVSHPDAKVKSLSAEHGMISVDSNHSFNHGERMTLVPHYSDSTVLLHRNLFIVKNDIVEDVWEISGSGALQ